MKRKYNEDIIADGLKRIKELSVLPPNFEPNNLLQIPKDILATIITYLSFKEVEALCNSSMEMLDFCKGVKKRDRDIWRELIFDTFPKPSDDIIKLLNCKYDRDSPDNCWNYITYTTLVKLLDLVTQGKIYIRMNDMEEFNNLPVEVRNFAAAFEKRRDLMEVPSSNQPFYDADVEFKLYAMAKYILDGYYDDNNNDDYLNFYKIVMLDYPHVLNIVLHLSNLSENNLKGLREVAFKDLKTVDEMTNISEESKTKYITNLIQSLKILDAYFQTI